MARGPPCAQARGFAAPNGLTGHCARRHPRGGDVARAWARCFLLLLGGVCFVVVALLCRLAAVAVVGCSVGFWCRCRVLCSFRRSLAACCLLVPFAVFGGVVVVAFSGGRSLVFFAVASWCWRCSASSCACCCFRGAALWVALGCLFGPSVGCRVVAVAVPFVPSCASRSPRWLRVLFFLCVLITSSAPPRNYWATSGLYAQTSTARVRRQIRYRSQCLLSPNLSRLTTVRTIIYAVAYIIVLICARTVRLNVTLRAVCAAVPSVAAACPPARFGVSNTDLR